MSESRPLRRVLLLGGTGFIGSRVLGALRERPGVRVMVVGHRNVPYRELEDVALVVGSLTSFDLEWIERFEPDTIIHLARLSGRGRVRRRVAAARGNRANRRIAAWLRRHAPHVHVVYVSGTLVYGNGGESEVDERAPVRPIAFAREYIEAERPWMEAQQDGSLPVTIVRPPWVVGPGSWLQAFFLGPALRSGAVPVYGTGDNWMSLLEVADCGRAIVHVAAHARPPATVNVLAPGQLTRQRQFAETLGEMLGVGVQPVHVEERIPDRAVREALTSSCRAATVHRELIGGVRFATPSWPDMLRLHVPR